MFIFCLGIPGPPIKISVQLHTFFIYNNALFGVGGQAKIISTMKKFSLFALVVLLIGCTNDASQDEQLVDRLPIKINLEKSRANDTAFESGDQVGLYVVNYNGSTAGTLTSTENHINNACFTLSTDWRAEEELYWKDASTKADFYAYYPYGNPTDVLAYPFSVNTDQSAEADYWASDFLWGKRSGVAPTKNAVTITTEHLLSNALVYIKAGEGYSATELATADVEVKICNIKNSATINLATGVATATGGVTEIIPWNTGAYYRAMIVPQTVSSDTNLVSVKINGKEYAFATDITFAAGTQHKIEVTISAPSNGLVASFSIKEWSVDDNIYSGEAIINPGAPMPNTKLVKEIAICWSDDGLADITYNFTYDNSGRATTITEKWRDEDTIQMDNSWQIEYTNDGNLYITEKVYSSEDSSVGWVNPFIVELNSNGLIESRSYVNYTLKEDNPYSESFEYVYDSQNYLQSARYCGYDYICTSSYEWSNGNLTKSNAAWTDNRYSSTYTRSLQYTYNNTLTSGINLDLHPFLLYPVEMGLHDLLTDENYTQISMYLLAAGYIGRVNKNYLAEATETTTYSSADNYTSTVKYQWVFDSHNRPTTCILSDGFSLKISYIE